MLPSKYKKEKKDPKDNLLGVSNSLVESFIHENNVIALKILFYIAHAKFPVNNSELLGVNIDAKKLCEYCNTDNRTINRNIKKMVETAITYVEKDVYESHVSLIVEAKINYGGLIEITMLKKVLDLVKKTSGSFSQVDFKNLMKMEIKHSIRMLLILEMIKQFGANVPKRKYYTLEELNGLFGTNYKTIYAFEQKIIKKIKEELDEKSKLSFIYRKKMDKERAGTAGRPTAVGLYIDLIDNKNRQLGLF
jgi:hypothetical protein